MEVWGFLWLMFVLKIPIVALLWIVWWAVRSTPEPDAGPEDDDGGIRPPRERPPLPRDPRRRGPHGDSTVPAPPRSRTPAWSRDRVSR